MPGLYDDNGIRFLYPDDWGLEVDGDESRVTVSLHAPDGVAFALVALDEACPEPTGVAGQALEAMRDEYPELESIPVLETIDGHRAVGHDIEFMSLDATNGCSIRCFRTDRRTVLLFGQWSDLEGEAPARQFRELRGSLAETDV